MNVKSEFSVTLPPFAFTVGLFVNIITVAIAFLQTILSNPPP